MPHLHAKCSLYVLALASLDNAALTGLIVIVIASLQEGKSTATVFLQAFCSQIWQCKWHICMLKYSLYVLALASLDNSTIIALILIIVASLKEGNS